MLTHTIKTKNIHRKALFVKRDKYIGVNGQVLSKLQDGGCYVKTGDSMIIIKVFFRDKLYRFDELIKMVGVRLGTYLHANSSLIL